MLIFVIPRTKNQSITVKGNNIALGFATASTQEGSTTEGRARGGSNAVNVRLWNHPGASRHPS
jgi:hypothetical protein